MTACSELRECFFILKINKNDSKKEVTLFQKLIYFIYLGTHSRKSLESAHSCQIRPILVPVRL